MERIGLAKLKGKTVSDDFLEDDDLYYEMDAYPDCYCCTCCGCTCYDDDDYVVEQIENDES